MENTLWDICPDYKYYIPGWIKWVLLVDEFSSKTFSPLVDDDFASAVKNLTVLVSCSLKMQVVTEFLEVLSKHAEDSAA